MERETETVIHLAEQPPYVVQQLEPGEGWYQDGFSAAIPDPGVWLDIKGFSRETFAIGYADELKRENPATDYRVVKTGGE